MVKYKIGLRTSSHVCTLMVTSQEEEILRIFNLVTQQQQDRLQRLLAAIYVITQEEVICRGGESAHFE